MAGQNKRQEIMSAAEQLFSNRRFHEVTLDEIAQAARVGKGTIYRFFSSKDDLFFQTATSGFDDLCDVIEKNVCRQNDFTRQLLSACEEITEFFYRRRQIFRIMQMEEGRVIWSQGSLWDRWMSHRGKLVKALARILDRGTEEKRIRYDVPTTVLADFLLGMLRTRTRYLLGADDSVKRLDVLLNIFLSGALWRPEDIMSGGTVK
jgi:AcrR family transcriptional regulator